MTSTLPSKRSVRVALGGIFGGGGGFDGIFMKATTAPPATAGKTKR